ncbi:DNA helicase-2/ATP-dependent DNA helicase PcrA [Ezakiella coagulans]|uniref:ATP-dependent DNA helicase PcrA n=1 Tax=Ezakiella coagulans TaxID=46507 RepID=A0A2U1E589_9FIRM|nr:UvrD-helicase domain-containing protein [Ezakiella coagulans]PVY94849.1 DNA helicase-2/ATP-dependent DNA helicase PcrA [Ezakiella coagulans]
MDIKNLLNESQYEAVVNTEGPVLVLAGAGSGKTRVVTYKIAYLVKEIGINPFNILAITFTNKAANEMKERAEELLERSINGMWIGTFHSICVRILRKHYSSNFTIYDTQDSVNLIKRIIKDRNLDSDQFKPKSIKNRISDFKNKGMGVKEFQEFAGSDFYLKIVGEIFFDYEAAMKEANALDFDDLLLKTVKIFEANPSVCEEYSSKFDYIFVDEYQDVNDIQYKFIKAISHVHNNLTVVGDENQSIYAFRGANLENILNFERDFKGAKVIYLNQNYRSTKSILDAANHLILNNPQKYKRELLATKADDEKVKCYNLMTGDDEAYKVLEIIENLKDSGEKYSDIAILYRTNNQSRAFEDVFVRNSIPYEIIGGIRFYDRKEVKDVLAYLKLLNNPFDSVSFERIVNTPRRGVGPKTLGDLNEYRLVTGKDYFETLSDIGTKSAKQFGEDFIKIREVMNDVSLSELVDIVLEKSEYLKELKVSKNPEDESRVQNVYEFVSYVKEYENKNPESELSEMLNEISLLSDIDQSKEEDKVVLMTVHSSKGLEFRNVFVVGLEEGLFPSRMSMEDEKDVEEERRLFYVALTRARDRLFLTSADSRMIYGQTIYSKNSRFLEEIKDFVEIEDETVKSKVKTEGKPIPRPTNFTGKIGLGAKKEKAGSFNIGDKVIHKMWGEGTVVTLVGDDITIAFPSKGLKKLKASIAPLTKK